MSASQRENRAGSPAQRGERVAVVFDRRFPVMSAGKELLRKAFPDHWSFLLGEIALYSFVVLVVTGVYLTFYFHQDMTELPYTGSYRPLQGVEMSQAYTSVLHISFDVRGGLLIRQIHHWGALVFIAAIGVHMLRIFFTGVFRRPREGNWMIGVTLFWLSLLEGFCGYSLPDDLLSGTGLRTADGIVLSVPVVGSYLSFFIWGGEYPGHEIIPRMYAAHILLIPGIMIALITVHLFLVIYLKHTQWAKRGNTNRNVVGKPMVPQYAAKSIGLLFTLAGVLTAMSALMQINPIWDYGPYRTDQSSINAQPDWYVGFLEGALRLMPGVESDVAGHTIMWNVFLPGVVLPLSLFAVLYLYPFFERWITGQTGEHHFAQRPRNQPTRTGLGVAAVCVYAVLLLAGGQDVLAYVFKWPVEWLTYIYRTLLFALPVLAYWATKRACLGLQARDRRRIGAGDALGDVQLTDAGVYQQRRALLPGAEQHRLLVRDAPRPLTYGTEPSRFFHKHRVRNALSSWYFRDRVELPATEQQRQRIEEALTDPPDARAQEKAKDEGKKATSQRVRKAAARLLFAAGNKLNP